MYYHVEVYRQTYKTQKEKNQLDHIKSVPDQLPSLHWPVSTPQSPLATHQSKSDIQDIRNGIHDQTDTSTIILIRYVRRLQAAADTLILIPGAIKEPTFRTAIGRRSFRHVAFKTWNSLPETTTTIDTLESFRRQMKTILFRQS